jgi:hypothetical protein
MYVYVCIYACMYVCVCMYACAVYMYEKCIYDVCMYVCMYACICIVCLFVCMYVCMYVCLQFLCDSSHVADTGSSPTCVFTDHDFTMTAAGSNALAAPVITYTYVCVYVCMHLCMYVCKGA